MLPLPARSLCGLFAVDEFQYHISVPKSRGTYVRRQASVFGLLAVLLSGAFYAPITLLAPLTSTSPVAVAQSTPANPTVELSWPGVGTGAIGAVGFPGVLATGGSTAPHTIASITKIITSLVVLDAKPIPEGTDGPIITMTANDASLYYSYLRRGGEVKDVRAGLQLTERQVLQVTLVASANNYAESISTWAFGSQPAFLAAAASWLDSHGLKDTILLDSSGMNPGNKSTTADLVALGKLAVTDPVISSIIKLTSVTLPYIGTVRNTNKLLGIDGIKGIKTGTLPQSGACLLFASEVTVGTHTVTVIGVLLGGIDHPSLDASVRNLLTSAKAGFRELTLATKGETFSTYSTPWGQDAHAVATRGVSVLTWAGTPVTVLVQRSPVRTQTTGSLAGGVTFTVGTFTLGVPLELDAPIEDPGPWWRLSHPVW